MANRSVASNTDSTVSNSNTALDLKSSCWVVKGSPHFSRSILWGHSAFVWVQVEFMSKQSQLRDHLAVIASQCDLLEDLYSARPEATTAIKVIRNAAHRIAKEIEDESRPAPQLFAEVPNESARDNADIV